ncbi:MAG: hypothetical protein IVW56_09200 [Candidatus Binataceae bacterium]|nr:hypothetical protein [Candidatus Binataceae bacterium]
MEPQIQADVPVHPADQPLEIELLSRGGALLYVFHGIGVTLGMGILWMLEVVRNSYFRLLDRTNFKARTRPASAFPPGRPRRRPIADAPHS